MREASLVVIHSAATPNGRPNTVEDIRRWHTDPKPIGKGPIRECPVCSAQNKASAWKCGTCGQTFGNGWKVPGYHYVIELTGYAKPLVKLNDDEYLEPWEIANGAYGYNSKSAHVCMIGTDKFNKKQWLSLTNLIYELEDQFPKAKVVGHNQLNQNKRCPGFYVPQWLEQGRGVFEKHLL